MSRHSIHLGAAWESPRDDSVTAWLRRFGRPTGLAPSDRVLLVCEGAQPAAAWRRLLLNGHDLPPPAADPGRWEHDVTAILRDRNELALEPAAGGPVGNAARGPLPAAWGRFTLEIDAPH